MSDRADLLQRYCLALLKGARLWRQLADAAVDGFDLSEAAASPLMFIARLGDGVRPSALAEAIGIEGPSLVRLLDQLSAAALVERREDATDRRAKTLHLTKRGVRLAASLAARLDEARNQAFASLTDAEIRTALKVLVVLEQASDPGTTPDEGVR